MKKILLLLIFALSFSFFSCRNGNQNLDKFKSESAYGQFAPPDAFEEDSNYAYYGAENEWNRRMFSKKAADKFYKRRGQRQLLAILDGHPEKAVKYCNKRINEDGGDVESMFVLSLAYCNLNELERAYQTAIEAVKKGLPFERFLAGPRDLLEPLYHYSKFKKLIIKNNVKLIHGPLLGSVTDSSARLWFRTVDESKIVVKLFLDEERNRPAGTAAAKTSADKDYTGIVQISNLLPETKYFYDLFIDGEEIGGKFSFTTFPDKERQERLRIIFGGGAGYTPEHEKIWNTIYTENPDALLLLGDNVYIDLPQTPNAFHDYTYYRRQSRLEFRKLAADAPVYTIWDDHDAATDDIWMGPYLDKPKWKLPMLKHFEQQWNNPAYGAPEAPGCYYNFSIGKVDFFMLDCRFYRTNPFKNEKTMLGPAQKKWLEKKLLESSGVFKLIVSSVPWAMDAKPGSRDTWAGFKKEREEIFSFIEKNKIEGVVLLSADRHRSDAWKIKRKKGYDFYEFMSSRLTNIHTHKLMPGAMFGYNKKCSFGELNFDLRKNNPALTYKIINIDGEIIDSLTVNNSRLTF